MSKRWLQALSIAMLGITTLVGCGGGGGGSTTVVPVQTTRASTTSTNTSSYNGSGSVGDFFNITVDHAAQTITYSNLTNGTSGTVTYTVNADGSYALSDPGIVSAVEVKDMAMVLQCNNGGTNRNTPCLVTAVQSQAMTPQDMYGNSYNYMQWRTNNGGVEIGYIDFDAQGNGAHMMYSPVFAQEGQASIHDQPFANTLFSAGPANQYVVLNGNNAQGTIFGTASGYVVFDTPNGSGVCMKATTSSAFDPANAGTYHAIRYSKSGAQENNNTESGTPDLGRVDVVVDGSGNLTVTDPANNNTLVFSGALTPVANASYLVGNNKFADPCNGMFTCRTTTANSQSDLFVTFMQGSLFFSYYQTALPYVAPFPGTNGTYDYSYGVGLKQS